MEAATGEYADAGEGGCPLMGKFKMFCLVVFHIVVLAVYAATYNARSPPEESNLDSDYPFDWEIYRSLLENLTNMGYTFVLPRDYVALAEEAGKYAIVVHDCDFDLRGVQSLWYVEELMDVKSCWYLRPNAEYFVRKITYFQELEDHGWEIGMHYDCLSCMDGDREAAVSVFEWQLDFMRRYFNVTTVRSHGDKFNLAVDNTDLFNASWFGELGIHEIHVGYSVPEATYVRDTNGALVIPPVFENLVLVNFHSDHWSG